MEKTIELDCAPGGPRPGELIGQVVAGTILQDLPEAQPDASVSRLFGNWTWAFPKVSDEDWIGLKPILRDRITTLYHSGVIRYGSW